MKRAIPGLLAIGCAATPLRAQFLSYSHDRELRITTLDTITAAPRIQHARIDRSHGDTILIYDLSPGPLRAGAIPATTLVEARWTHGHAIVGAVVGFAAGYLSGRIFFHDGDAGIAAGLLSIAGIPVGAMVGASIRTTTWVPLRTTRFTLEVGAAGPGLGVTFHAADHP
jgi:hypothetical protein